MSVMTEQHFGGRPLDAFAPDAEEQQSASESNTGPGTDSQPVEKRGPVANERGRRRFQIKSAAQLIRLDCAVVEPEVVTLVDANSKGILFITDRDDLVGTQMLVKFPYPSSTAPKQMGSVVRVEILPDGKRRVAIAFG